MGGSFQMKCTALIACVGAFALLTGCGGGGSSTVSNNDRSLVRVFNGYIGANGSGTPLTVTANREVISGASGAAFGVFTPVTGYTRVLSGQLTITGTGSGVSTPLTLQHAVNLIRTWCATRW